MATFIILAAGNGTRMNTDLPKVLVDVNGKAMIERILENCESLASRIILVVSPTNKDQIQTYLTSKNFVSLEFVTQELQLGTGHAVQSCMSILSEKDEQIIILNGDMPLIQKELLYDFINYPTPCIATTKLASPTGYGRIITVNGKMIGIVEEKDCNVFEKAILEVNVGMYMFSYDILLKYIFDLKNNNKQNEYYLPDLVRLCINNCININRYVVPMNKQHQVKGVNTKIELEEVETLLKYYH